MFLKWQVNKDIFYQNVLIKIGHEKQEEKQGTSEVRLNS